MPDHWQATTLGEVSTVVGKRVNPVSVPRQRYLGLEHLDPDVRSVSRWGFSDEVKSATAPFSAGDTLVGRLRPYLQKGIRAPFDGLCSTEILVLRASKHVDSRFLAPLVLNDRVFRECDLLSAGTRMPRVSARDLMRIRVSVPPLAEQRRIVEVIGAIDDQVAALESQADATRTARAGVLQELLSGRRLLDESYDRAVGGLG